MYSLFSGNLEYIIASDISDFIELLLILLYDFLIAKLYIIN